MDGLDPTTLLVFVAALLGAGAVAGVLAGLLGIGGGIVIVPVLYQVFAALGIDEAVRMHAAVGTSLATILPTGLSSARAHWRRGAIDPAVLRAWGPWVALGVLIGTGLATVADGRVLTGLFALVSFSMAIRLFTGSEDKAVRDTLPPTPWSQVIATSIGGISAMLGIGGGTFSVPAQVMCGATIRRAVGTAAAIGLIIAVPGAIGFAVTGSDVSGRPPLSVGYVNLLALACIVPASVAAAPLGARIAHSIDGGLLRKGFALFLLIVCGRMVASLF